MAREPLILIWNDAWIDIAGAQALLDGHGRISTDRSDFGSADAVVFALPTLVEMPEQRDRTDQVWVLWCQECNVHFPQLNNALFTDRFDLLATYRLDSDVPIPYVTGSTFDVPMPLPDTAEQHSSTLASAWISSRWDRCGRNEYLVDLMRHISIDSFGKIANNATLSNDDGVSTKLVTMRNYRFCIAFENSIAPDYVTEKLLDPLLVGTVPIYRGAPNAAEFVPSTDCFIDATKFASPLELADFLKTMTPTQHQQYFAWRTTGVSAGFKTRMHQYNTHAFIRLSRAIRAVQIGRQVQARSTANAVHLRQAVPE